MKLKAIALVRQTSVCRGCLYDSSEATNLKFVGQLLDDFEQVSPRIAHIKPLRARNGPAVRDDFDARVAKSRFGFGQIRNRKTDVTRTQRSARFVFHRKVQLVRVNLIPRATRSRCSRFWYLFQSQHRAIELLSHRFEFGRNCDVHVMKRGDHSGPPTSLSAFRDISLERVAEARRSAGATSPC